MAKIQSLPGMEQRVNNELTECALEYSAARDSRMAAAKPERELKLKLLGLMRANKLRAYRDDERDMTVTLETKTNVKVKIGSEEDLEADEE